MKAIDTILLICGFYNCLNGLWLGLHDKSFAEGCFYLILGIGMLAVALKPWPEWMR